MFPGGKKWRDLHLEAKESEGACRPLVYNTSADTP